MRPLGAAGFVVSAYLALFGGALWQHLAGDAGEGIVCAAPAVLAAVLSATSQTDRRQYAARLFAALLFLPILLVMWATSHERADPWLFAFALGHLLGVLAVVAWLASFATRIDPAPGVAPVGLEGLRRRVASLSASVVPLCAMREVRPNEWLLDLREPAAEGRTHRVRLEVDEQRHAVRVGEFLGASGAAPRAEHEASMRGPGDHWFDPTRPDAQSIWSRTWQSTMIEPERLARAAQQLGPDGFEQPAKEMSPVDGETLVTLLAALVTRSGYAWRPRLLPGLQRRWAEAQE